jgi:salicylate hydroxylase
VFLVVGGGIAGLTCALSLAQRGFGVRVLEQAPELAEIGAGIQLGPNMNRALDQLGLRDRVLADAWFPDQLVLRDACDGSTVTTIAVGEGFRARFGHPYAVTHRADLLDVLADACERDPRVELLTSRCVREIVDHGDRVAVAVDGGETFEGPGLVGADGIWSTVREHVIGDGRPKPVGHIAYRAVLPRDEVPDELWSPDMTIWAGPRIDLVHYPLRRGELFNLVAVFHSDRYAEGWDEAGDPLELRRHFEGTHDRVRTLLERIETWRFWVLCDREPRRGWSRGRVTLAGDAAHPMLQYLAQGAAQAVEDAVCLAQELARADGDPLAAFPRYEERRVLRAGRAQVMARVYGDAYHASDVTRELRDRFLAGRTPEQGWDSVAWLYDHDPTGDFSPAAAAGLRDSGTEVESGRRVAGTAA